MIWPRWTEWGWEEIGMVAVGLFIVALFVMLGCLVAQDIDHDNDIRVCKGAFLETFSCGETFDSCFALNDWDNMNYGKDIDCSCYGRNSDGGLFGWQRTVSKEKAYVVTE